MISTDLYSYDEAGSRMQLLDRQRATWRRIRWHIDSEVEIEYFILVDVRHVDDAIIECLLRPAALARDDGDDGVWHGGDNKPTLGSTRCTDGR